MAKAQEIRLTISDPKSGKSYKKVLTDQVFLNRKIGDTINGNIVGLDGYELKITGGSDDSGFPLRAEIEGAVKKKPIFRGKTTGFHPKKRKPQHKTLHHYHLSKRKTVRGNTIVEDTAQVNLSVVKSGSQALEAVFGAQEKPAVEQ
ncbi:MAG: S6e family ribosomal protein [Candidatus Nanoarchaeia archaeon]|nr:S6e family ribosomal protein [Candidatus Nanoarchaeia archaeon]